MTGAPPPPPNFDRLAGGYRALEFLAFGRDLERARTAFADRLAGCRDILVLGEGDGRYLARLVQAAPAARIHCVDASAAMLARASARLAGTPARDRVTFERADAFSLRLSPERYDAVVTLFFLDCFPAEQVAVLVDRVRASLRPGALWAWADFAVPLRGWARWRARVWLALLYAFFRWQTGLAARELPPAEEILQHAGFRLEASRQFQGGLVRSALFSSGAFRSAAARGKD
jgi:ubiquinone/menaquinone biosynthesis C-methylase UbiE